jgi:hypothetical protein
MFKKLIYLVSFFFVLGTGINAQAAPIPVSVDPSVEAVIGDDGNVTPGQTYTTYNLQVSDHINGVTQGRRVTLVSYDISGLKKDYQYYQNMSFSVLGFISGNVDVYGVVEDQDNIDGGLKWNNSPGVVNDQVFGYPVELDIADLTDKLFSFTAPNRGERKSIGTSQALDDFVNGDTDGIVTFLLAPPEGSSYVLMRSSMYPGGGMILEGEITTGIDIIWVSDAHDLLNPGGEPDDQGWVDLLEADGYDVDYQKNVPGSGPWQGDLTEEQINALNSTDLVIISRDASTGGHNRPDAWNSIETPMLSLNNYMSRSSRWQWVNSTAIDARQEYYDLKADDPTHPIFDGVELDPNNVVQWYDPNAGSGYTGFFATADVGNGHLIGSRPDNGNLLIAEWKPGYPFYVGTNQVPAGKRVLFCAGNQEDDNNLHYGQYNLSAEGEKMFLNAVQYILQPTEPDYAPILKLDVQNSDDPANVEAGFTAFTFANSGTAINGITVTLDGYGEADSRRRDVPTGASNENIYRDFIFGRQSEPGVGYVSVTLSGLEPDATYQITIYSWDTYSTGLRVTDWTANGEPLFTTMHDGNLEPPAGDDKAYKGLAMADPNGVILMEAVPGEGTFAAEPFAFINALVISVPVVYPGLDGLVASYHLDGDASDSSGNGLDGTIVGEPVFDAGIAGLALLTDGVDDYVDCGNDSLFDITEQITLATWVNVNDFGNGENDPWISKGDHAWCIKGHRTGYAIEFFVYEGTWNWISADVGDINNEWHHAAGTFDGTQLKIYLDGALISTKDYVGGIATSVHNVAIGTNTEAGGRFSEGLHDEVYIYNRALSINEIAYLAGI